MNIKTILIHFFLIFLISTPVLGVDANKQNQIQIFANDKAGKPYVVIGQILAKATQNENCIEKLQKKTAQSGGDVILNYEVGATGTHGAWTGAAVIICKGIAARWAKGNETGQTAINTDAPMPVLTLK